MKPEIKALVKFGVAVSALNFAMDIGKACMFKAFRVKSPEAAEEMLKFMDNIDDYKDVIPISKQLRLKWIRKLCKFI